MTDTIVDGQYTLKGKIAFAQAFEVLVLTLDAWFDGPVTYSGLGTTLATGKLKPTEFGPIVLNLHGINPDQFPSYAALFEIVTYHTGFGKDRPFTVISFYSEFFVGGSPQLVATAVIPLGLDIDDVAKGHIKWEEKK
jgi:hypothetical protein